MKTANLIVVGGCNGSGKSTYANMMIDGSIKIFDADLRKKQVYDSFKFDFDLREEMSWNKVQQEFKDLITSSLGNNTDFAYETNFHYKPMFIVDQFKKESFNLNLIFFCLETVELAIKRVAIRYESGGHFVPNKEVKSRYIFGLKNLNLYYKNFDNLLVVDASKENSLPRTILKIQQNKLQFLSDTLPGSFEQYCSDLIENIKKEINH